MKKITALFFVFAFIMSIPCSASAEFKKTKIAVLDFQLQGGGHDTKDMGSIVEEWLITAFVQEGRFEVIERRMLEKILIEQKLVMTGLVDQSKASELGKLLGVKVIITGSVMKFQDILEVNARIIDVEDASIIAAESVKSTTAIRLEDLVVKMAEVIIKDFPLEGYIVNRDAEKVTIDLGKRAGVKPGMRFIVYREGKIIKHPKTGEVLDVESIQTGIIEIDNVRAKIAEAKIIESKTPDSIQYSQMVKSIDEPSIPPIRQEKNGDPIPTPGSPPRTPLDTSSYAKMLQSPDTINKRKAAKAIAKARVTDTAILDIVENELLKGYQTNLRNRNHVDLMAWLCNALGNSNQSKYTETLKNVARNTRSRKIKQYATLNLRKLQ